MSRTLIYSDYNAGAPVRPEAADAVARALAVGGNPSSVHGAGRRARALVEDARERVAVAVSARAENVVFTSGATEALHLAMSCAGASSLIVSAVEHDAVFEHAARAPHVQIAPVNGDGLVDRAALSGLLERAEKPALVVVQLANNETGVVQNIPAIGALCREHGALLLVDAAQALGRVPVDIADLDAAYLVLSSHKLGGPPGVGALVLNAGAPFVTTRFGGGQERGRRPGTENVAAIAGFGVAAEIAARACDAERARLLVLRDLFESGLPADAVVFGNGALRLSNTSNFALPGITAETAVIAMDLAGVAVSSGAACSSGKVRSSRVLAAMGAPSGTARAALRVSFGWASTQADVDVCLAALREVSARRALAGAV